MNADIRGARSSRLWIALIIALAFLTGTDLSRAFSSSTEGVLLQPLIDATPQGETLLLDKGQTYVGPAIIAKEITIRSEGEATVTNDSEEPVITILADGVVLQDFIVRNLNKDPKKPAILVQSDRNRLERLRIVAQGGGIYLRDANDNEIRGSRIEGANSANRKEAFSKRGNGIDLHGSSRNLIEDNTIIHMHDGVYVESSNAATVRNNYASDSRYGFHFMFSGQPVLEENIGEGNVTGGMVMGVEGAIVHDNRFDKQTENVNSQGILLFDVHRSEISGNRVDGNRVGLYIENSTENILSDNEVSRNFIGMQMIQSDTNSFRNSAFVGNVIQAQSTESVDNELRGNYWEDIEGLDTNGDGYSDMTYEIDPFFLQVTKDIDAFQVFFQSPGMPFLAQMFQADTSNWLKDLAPKMEPPDWYDIAEVSDNRWFPLTLGVLLLILSITIIYRWGYRKS
ncbi:right-handed parallel beta-helix repeat-containing protein [Cohnella thailandensis]|nr:NosD domain-containing protein [Cohnella thailandensis]